MMIRIRKMPWQTHTQQEQYENAKSMRDWMEWIKKVSKTENLYGSEKRDRGRFSSLFCVFIVQKSHTQSTISFIK